MYSTGNIANIFYSNYLWSITFKNCESLGCKPETYNIIHQLYLNLKKKKRKQSMVSPKPQNTQMMTDSVPVKAQALFLDLQRQNE